MDLREVLLAVFFTAIAVVVAVSIYPVIHNAVDPCQTYNASMACTAWKNTSPMSGVELAMLNLITLIFPAGIALTPVGLIYVMSKQ